MPEVQNNIDMTTGNLGLTDKQEDQMSRSSKRSRTDS